MLLSSPYIDITPVLRASTAVFPGDTPFSRSENMSFEQGQHLEVSEIRTTVHVGAHADAPSHYHAEGKTIEERDLSLYLGLCQVVEVSLPLGERIRPQDLKCEINAPRVLFKTDSFPHPDLWNGDFNSLSPELIDFLQTKQVRLVGIDTPSVDPATDQVMSAHKAIYRADMAILEGIVLTSVKPGLYQLIALPLPIEGADASPVRAILLNSEKN